MRSIRKQNLDRIYIFLEAAEELAPRYNDEWQSLVDDIEWGDLDTHKKKFSDLADALCRYHGEFVGGMATVIAAVAEQYEQGGGV